MTKQLTVDDILSNCFYKLDKHIMDEHPDPDLTEPCKYGDDLRDEAKQSLKALVTEMVNEIIGDDDDSVRNPSTGARDIHNVWRNNFRAEIRNRAKAKIERRFL